MLVALVEGTIGGQLLEEEIDQFFCTEHRSWCDGVCLPCWVVVVEIAG